MDNALRASGYAAKSVAFRAAEAHRTRGNLAAALDILQALFVGRVADGVAGLDAGDMLILERLADLAILADQTAAADSLLDGLVILTREAGNACVADYGSFKRIHLALEDGRLSDAERLLRAMEPSIGPLETIEFSPTGLTRWEARLSWPVDGSVHRTALLSRAYLVLGCVSAALGKYGQALTALRRGLVSSGPKQHELAQQARLPLRLALAAALSEQGDLQSARAQLETARPDLDETRAPGFFVRWLEITAKLCLLEGDLGAARVHLERIRRHCLDRGFGQAALKATLNLAQVLTYLNQTSAATELLVAAREAAVRLGDVSGERRTAAVLRVARARGESLAVGVAIGPTVADMWLGDSTATAQSAGEQDDALEVPPQSANYLTFFEDRALGFYWELSRGNLSAAAGRLADMRRVFELSDSAVVRTRLVLMSGTLAYYRGDLTVSAIELDRARQSFTTLGLIPDQLQAQRVLRWCWSRGGRPTVEQGALLAETEAALRKMTATLPESDQPVFLLNKWTADEEYIASEIDCLTNMQQRLARGSRLLRPFRRWSVIRRLHRLQQHLDRSTQERAKRTLFDSTDVRAQLRRPVALWRSLLQHPRGRATLSFVVLPDRVLIVRAGWLSLDFGVSAISRIQVREIVARWHESMARPELRAVLGRHMTVDAVSSDRSPDLPPEKTAWTLAQSLAEVLQIPQALRALPARVRGLTIVADDSLHGFPFAAIVHNGAYLIENYSLSIRFRAPGERPPTRLSPDRAALAVGVAVAGLNFGPLPGTSRELDKVVSIWARQGLRATSLKDAAATRQAVLEHLPDAAMAHIACHGVFEANSPDRSGLILIPEPPRSEVLSLRDLSGLDLARLRHVTLSSCWSADHFVLPGRWIISLPETLWRAGVNSILGCLWEVNDQLAVQLMTHFYTALQAGVARDEALRRAQLSCLGGDFSGGGESITPAAWAGFTLYGDYRPLRFGTE